MRTTAATASANTAPDRPRTIRDLASWRLARLAGLNDRAGHAVLTQVFGIALGDWRVFALIAADAPLNFAQLAHRTLLDKGQLSRTVARLVARGWVISERAATNRRTVHLGLTAAGEREYHRIFKFVDSRTERMLASLTDDERQTLRSLIDRLTHIVEGEFAHLAAKTPPERIATEPAAHPQP